MRRILILSALMVPLITATGEAAFPIGVNSGVADSTSQEFSLRYYSIPNYSGICSSTGPIAGIGYLYVEDGAWDGFLKGNFPARSQAVAPLPEGAVILTEDQNVLLRWTDGSNGSPVNYRVYFGKNKNNLQLMSDIPDLEMSVFVPEFFVPHYWRIVAHDGLNRSTESDLFSFTIAQPIGKPFCAPNPYKPSEGNARFVFGMPGTGNAEIKIYSLPHMNPVFETTLNGLAAGPNFFDFNGKDNNGESLYNGVYMVTLRAMGESGENKNRFKLVIVR